MKKFKKRIFAIVLTITMIINPSLVQWAVGDGDMQEVYAQENVIESVSMGQEQLEVSGNNGVGSLLAKEINGELTEQQENQGYTIFDVTVEGKMATVSLDVIEDCRLIAGIYSENGKDLLASGVVDVEKTAKDAVVTLETQEMPQYFLVKAFLVDETMAPLCSVYQSELYTKEMQEFLTKTTDDFEQNNVLNLDEDKTNNFAVYKDSVKKIEKENNKNIVVSANDETGVYVLENIDSTIKNLKNGDIFAYTYDGQELIVKVDSVVVNGKTATIYSQETSLDEVFDYVKIDNTGDLSNATVDTSNLDEDVVYNGLVEGTNEAEVYSEEGIMPMIEVEGKHGVELSYTLKEKKLGNDDDSVKVSGGLKINVQTKVKAYITLSYQYLEFKLDYSVKVSVKGEGKGTYKKELGSIKKSLGFGVSLKFTPTFITRLDATIEYSGKLSAAMGFKYSSKNGFGDNSSTPKVDTQLKAEGTIFVGISFEPKLIVFSDKVAKASLEAEVGAELKATTDSKNGNTKNVKHECNWRECIDGDISAKAKISAKVKFLDRDKWSFSVKLLDINCKICDFYYSLTFADYGLKECPHFKYKVNVDVCDSDEQKLENVKIVVDGHEYETDDKGHAEFFVNDGNIIFTFSKTGYETYKKEVKINSKVIELDKKPKEISVKLIKEKGGTGDSGDEENDKNPDNEQEKLKIQSQTVSLGNNHSAAITEDGSLYLWGNGNWGQLGDGTGKHNNIPIKIMDNIASVSLGSNHSAAITKDGSLYLWGWNSHGELGNGTTEVSRTPIKIMDNVASVSLGSNHSAAITKDGSLYLWGNNSIGELGNGTGGEDVKSLIPIKIMDNVENVSLGNQYSAAITKDGSLYLWGNGNFGQLGDGTTWFRTIPKKIMDNVVSVSLGYAHSAAITKDGSLYLWGNNNYGQLGDGTIKNSSTPKKIMDNVVSVSLGGTDYYSSHSAAIAKDGSLYLWGYNNGGQLGNGTTKNSSIPKKIMDNVASVSLGSNHSAAITKDGSLYLWGVNGDGRLGNGTWYSSSTPIKIMDNVKLPSSKFSTQQTTLSKQMYAPTTYNMPTLTDNQIMPTTLNTTSSSFTNLTPNIEYMLYIVKSDETGKDVSSIDDILFTDNILYINQGKADENGNLAFDFNNKTEWTNVKVLLIGGNGDGNITLDDVELTCSIAPKTTVEQLKEKLHKRFQLVDSDNVEITDNKSFIQSGNILCLFDSKGEIAKRYTICIIGDVNRDGIINIQDAVILKRRLAGYSDLRLSEKASDINGDGILNIQDAVILLKYCAGMNVQLGKQ